MEKEIKRYFSLILFVIAIISLTLSVFAFSIYSNMFNLNFYRHDFNERMGSNDAEFYMNTTVQLLDYLKHQETNKLQDGVYTEKETNHMADVKVLVQNGIAAMWILLAVSLVLVITLYYLDIKKLAKAFRVSGLIVIGVSTASILAFLNFNAFFTEFHLILFSNSNWLLEPYNALIIMFPEGFFIRMGEAIIITSILLGAVFFCAGKKFNTLEKSKKHK